MRLSPRAGSRPLSVVALTLCAALLASSTAVAASVDPTTPTDQTATTQPAAEPTPESTQATETAPEPAAPESAPAAPTADDSAAEDDPGTAELAATGPVCAAVSTVQAPQNRDEATYVAPGGSVSCTKAGQEPLTYALERLPINGKVTGLPNQTGSFTYRPTLLYTGADDFTVKVTAKDGTSTVVTVPINVFRDAACSSSFVAKTGPTFNDPSGSTAAQFRISDYLVKLVDCTPAGQDIRVSFFSLTYAPFRDALVKAAKRGVTVKVLTNSHADKYSQWQLLEQALGTDAAKANFAVTCQKGCLPPRTPPAAGAPTAFFKATPASPTSRTVTFTDMSFPGAKPIKTWSWSFGNGKTHAGQKPPAITYAKNGDYKASLKVTDTAGKSNTLSFVVTIPDTDENYTPSMHSKMFLFSKTGLGSNARQWVAVYSSANPTYQQSRAGFNNAFTTVGNKPLYDSMVNYHKDLIKGSTGKLISANYYRRFTSAATTVHYYPRSYKAPQTSAGTDDMRQLLKNVKCVYTDPKTKKKARTHIRISMSIFTRIGLSADVWKMAYSKPSQWGGCTVEVMYTSMSQRTKNPSTGKYVSGTGWGVADCLSTPPTYTSKGKTKYNSLSRSGAYCGGGSLRGYPPKKQSGAWWFNKKSSLSGGTLRVGVSCPTKVSVNSKGIASIGCTSSSIHTHNKNLMIDGMVRDTPTSAFRKQKVVMTGSPNWTYAALRSNDEIGFTIFKNDGVYNSYKADWDKLYRIVSKTKMLSIAGLDGPEKAAGMASAAPAGDPPQEIALGLPMDTPGLED